MKSKFLLYCAITFSFLLFAFRMEEDSLLKLLNQLDAFTTKYPQEKVYIQSDKPYYAIGDNIWIKAYALNTKTQKPTKISGLLYVELIGEDNIIKSQIRLPMKNGVAWGDFSLPDTLLEGNYRIRAYTNYMRNFRSEFFYDKTIKIGNGWNNKVFLNSAFRFENQINSNQINAEIKFSDKNNQPIANKNINYEVFIDGKKINQVSKKTDARGNTQISFPYQQNSGLSGKIIATLDLTNKERIVKTIPILFLSKESDVQFFPEGGELIEGHPQKTAIKAIDVNGKGIDVTGEIIDQNNAVVGNFKTDFLGIGSFASNLKADGTYRSKIKFRDGSEKTVTFPKVKTSGYTLTVTNRDSEKITIRLTASRDLVNGSEFRIVGQQAGNVRFAFNAKMNSQAIIKSIPKDKFTTGIAQITVFSAQNQPLAERLVFINNKSLLMDLDVDNEKISKVTGGKSEIILSSPNHQLKGNFSISVTNEDKVNPDIENESNILTSLLLTGDLAGYVEKPNHYFLNENEQTIKELDDLMLTQGWRRISWKSITDGEQPAITYQPETSSISVSGMVVRNKKPIAKIPVFLLSKNGGDIMRDTITGEDGKFVFDHLNFADSTQFVVQATPLKKGSLLELKIDSSDNQSVAANKNIADVDVNVNSSLMKYIKASDNYFNEMTRLGLLEKSIKLDDVTITRDKIKKALQFSSNYNGPGNADQVITADDIPPYYSTLSQALGSRLRGVRIVNGVAQRIFDDQAFDIYYNGTRVMDMSLDRINAMDVQSVESLTSISRLTVYGRGPIPILLITTKRGSGYSAKKVKDLSFDHLTIKPKGLYPAREFYVPKYQVSSTDGVNNDRSTVFWKPNVIPNEEGKALINFDNAFSAGNYRVVIEGINDEGQLARKSFTYSINNNL